MELASDTTPTPPVMVFTGDDEPVQQPSSFKFCPLGVQFYSKKQLQECSIVEFVVDLPAGQEPARAIRCSGVVASCQREEDHAMYRVWIKFLDLPESARNSIECLTKSSQFLCPYCENF